MIDNIPRRAIILQPVKNITTKKEPLISFLITLAEYLRHLAAGGGVGGRAAGKTGTGLFSA